MTPDGGVIVIDLRPDSASTPVIKHKHEPFKTADAGCRMPAHPANNRPKARTQTPRILSPGDIRDTHPVAGVWIVNPNVQTKNKRQRRVWWAFSVARFASASSASALSCVSAPVPVLAASADSFEDGGEHANVHIIDRYGVRAGGLYVWRARKADRFLRVPTSTFTYQLIRSRYLLVRVRTSHCVYNYVHLPVSTCAYQYLCVPVCNYQYLHVY